MSANGSDGNGEHEAPKPSAEVDRLAGVAKEVNVVEAVANFNGAFIEFMQRETDAYVESVGGNWSDEGLAEWIKARTAEMQRAWRTDLDLLTGDK